MRLHEYASSYRFLMSTAPLSITSICMLTLGRAIRDFGHNVSFSEARAQIGKGGDQLLQVFLFRDETEAESSKLEEHRSQILKDRYLSQTKGFPKVRELMEHLLAHGHQIVLASSAKEEELQTYKKLTHIDYLSRTETSSDDAEKSKPNPDIFQAAIKRLGHLSPDDVIVVGDTPYDAEAASKAVSALLAYGAEGSPLESSCRQNVSLFIRIPPSYWIAIGIRHFPKIDWSKAKLAYLRRI